MSEPMPPEPGPAGARALAPPPISRAPFDPLGVRFLRCEWGWVVFTIDALLTADDRIRATHIFDPFPRMMRWLEAIAGGADAASWAIPQEGSSARLVFVAEHSGFLGDGRDRLIYIGDSEGDDYGKLFGFANAAVDRRALVAEFYNTFRAFTERGYAPDQWEWPPLLGPNYNRLTQDEIDEDTPYPPWSGSALQTLRSEQVERFLAGQDEEQEQFELILR